MKIRFNPGQVVMTPGAIDALAENGHTPGEFLRRHICGDWGDVEPGDAKENETAMKTGWRIFSVYKLKGGEKLWVITEAIDIQADGKPSQRDLTTLLLPSEY